MGEVIAHLAMSLDGFIADPENGCDEVSGFYQSGDAAVKLSEGVPELHVSEATADLLTASVARAGATVVGHRLYDLTNGLARSPRQRSADGRGHPPRAAGLAARRRTDLLPDLGSRPRSRRRARWPARRMSALSARLSPAAARIPGCWMRSRSAWCR